MFVQGSGLDNGGNAPWQAGHPVNRAFLDDVLNGRTGQLGNDYQHKYADYFRPGCPDDELPAHLTRRPPSGALSDAAVPIDLRRIVVNYEGDGLVPVWRDRWAGGAFLRPEHALYRMDQRGPELFESGFHPKNPNDLNVSAHTGGLPHGSGFVSLSMSPEHTVGRSFLLDRVKNGRVDHTDIENLVAKGDLEEDLFSGTYRQRHYMHEVYHPYGIDVGATFHDAQARYGRYAPDSYNESEILAPGGLSGDTIYRAWPRDIILDAQGRILSVHVGDPIVNPGFGHAGS
ncbi:hypothetical protein [Nocardia paucivorans]|uniref:hypothetical protein n=1 Tax=Nocardia paucivorans TaxID=114259 RepID=UPI000592DD6C|nr:hypothetical protein [Nocardia paucivorans]